MSKLTTIDRKSFSKKHFALPDEKRFPIEDEAHAENAKARAAHSEKAGNLFKTEKAKIDARADKALGRD